MFAKTLKFTINYGGFDHSFGNHSSNLTLRLHSSLLISKVKPIKFITREHKYFVKLKINLNKLHDKSQWDITYLLSNNF